MRPEEALGPAELEAACANGFSFTVNDGTLTVECPESSGRVPLDVSTSTTPVCVLPSDYDTLAVLVLPGASHPCTVRSNRPVKMEVRGPGHLIVELDVPRSLDITGDATSIKLATEVTLGVESSDAIQILNLPSAQRLEISGGSWKLPLVNVSRCDLDSTHLYATSTIECERIVNLSGRCVLDGVVLRAVDGVIQATGVVVLRNGTEIESGEIAETFNFEAEGNQCVVRTRRGSPTLKGKGLLAIDFVADMSMPVVVDAPDAHIAVGRCAVLRATCAYLRVDAGIESLSGEIRTLHAQERTVISCSNDCEIANIAKVEGAEILNLSPYQMDLEDLHRLGDARHVTFRFERDNTLHWERLKSISDTPHGNETALALWYRIGLLLEEHGGTGAERAIARRTEHEFRRRSIPGPWWKNPEKAWLSVYKLLGYGDSALRPLAVHLGICVVLLGLLLHRHIPEAPGRSWAVLWRMSVQPLRFFMKEESTLQLAPPLVPHRWAWEFTPLLVQVVGVVLVAMSLNAIRRLVKAR